MVTVCLCVGFFCLPNLAYTQSPGFTGSSIKPAATFQSISLSVSKGEVRGCATMGQLYFYSFFGKNQMNFSDSSYKKIYPVPILNNIDASLGKQLFCYVLSDSTFRLSKKDMLNRMQRDLDKYFGCRAKPERRKMPYWRLAKNNQFKESLLRTTDSMKLKVKNGLRRIDAIENGVVFRDVTAGEILDLIYSNNRLNRFDHPLIDETGIDYTIDLRMESYLTDKEGVIRELARNGLDLSLAEKEMEVVIVEKEKKRSSISISHEDSLRWQYLDPVDDGIYGVSLEKAYRELLSSKHADTIIVAIIDGGADTLHPDICNRLWKNKKENGYDADGNGYAGDLHGWNFLGGGQDNIIRVWDEFKREYIQFRKGGIPKRSGKNRDRYKLWLRVQEDSRKDSIRRVGLYLDYQSQIIQFDSLLRKEFGKEIYTLDDLNYYQPKERKYIAARVNILSQFKRDSITSSEGLQEFFNGAGLKRFSESLLDGDPVDIRMQVTGDDYTQIKGRSYGNGNIMVDMPEGKKILKHGTHVAGTIALHAPVKLMIIRAIPDGDEFDKDIALAIRYAVDNGARVINMSFAKELSPNQQWVEDAIRYASARDVLLINGAGNNGRNIDSLPMYPTAKFIKGNKKAGNMITVGASGMLQNKLVCNFSNYGNAVDVLAPGADIYSTIPGNGYGKMNGTSMATAVVSGIAATLRSYFPTLNVKDIKWIIENSVTIIKEPVSQPGTKNKISINKICRTGGIINLYNAVLLARQVMEKGRH
jgi:subtilisin family serine protease